MSSAELGLDLPDSKAPLDSVDSARESPLGVGCRNLLPIAAVQMAIDGLRSAA